MYASFFMQLRNLNLVMFVLAVFMAVEALRSFFGSAFLRKSFLSRDRRQVTPLASFLYGACCVVLFGVRFTYIAYPGEHGIYWACVGTFAVVFLTWILLVFVAQSASLNSAKLPLLVSAVMTVVFLMYPPAPSTTGAAMTPLSWFLLVIGCLSVFGSIQGFFFKNVLKTQQFNLKPEQVTDTARFLFGGWTLMASVVRVLCAFYTYESGIYVATMITFVVAFLVYVVQLVAGTIGIAKAWPPFIVAGSALVWMTIELPNHV